MRSRSTPAASSATQRAVSSPGCSRAHGRMSQGHGERGEGKGAHMPSSRKRRRSGRPGRSTGGTRAKPARAPQGSLETAQGCRRSGGAALPAQQPCCRAGLPCCQRRAAGLPAQGCAVTGAQRAAGARRAAGAAVQGSPASAQVSLALRAVTVLSVRRVKGRGTRPAPNLAKQATPGAAAQGCRCRAGLPARQSCCRAGLPRRAAGR